MQAIFYTCIYARTSKDDSESSSIENQIELIRNYTKSIPNIEIISEREDSGYSGTDFSRPNFGKMMIDIESGKINCVIVKDLSRLGRNYIEVGELMDEIFPRYNVRLIAINDQYDSINPRSDADEILIPFRNLINEQYARDTSGKVRSILSEKRKKGEFVGAFAPYGYKRCEKNKYQLIIDEHPASIIRDIFRYKIEGKSGKKIADYLNSISEPSPAEYKKRTTNYKAKFQTKPQALWSAVAIGRILSNPVYTGILTQGKQTTPNYKVKQRITRTKNEWSIIHDAHEPIISKRDFSIVEGLLRQDTRTAPKQDTVYPLSGMIFCADCGNSMVRTKSGMKFYYICASTRAKNKYCSSHCIQEEKLTDSVLESISKQIEIALDVERTLAYVNSLPSQQKNVAVLTSQLAARKKEIKSYIKYKKALYEDYKSGVISKEDYSLFGKDYEELIEELQQAAKKLKEEIELITNNTDYPAYRWITHFIEHNGVKELLRQLTANLIERVNVFPSKRVEIYFRFNNKIRHFSEVS